MTQFEMPDETQPANEPILRVPKVVLIILAVLLFVHVMLTQWVSNEARIDAIIGYSFIPLRFESAFSSETWDWQVAFTAVTYSLLHADWTHLIMNSVWLLAFGSVVARRLGWFSFLLFCALGAIAGALAHLLTQSGSIGPMIGASGFVSACMGAAVRFAFSYGAFSSHANDAPLLGLIQCLKNRQAMSFVAVWFIINLIVGFGSEQVAGAGQAIAWQAHIGGVLCVEGCLLDTEL